MNPFANLGATARSILPGTALAAYAVQAGPDTSFAHAYPAWARLAPRQIQWGPQIGFMGSRMTMSREYAALIRPTPAVQDAWLAPSYGALVRARWTHGISLTLAPRSETYGVTTREEAVAFPGNPFPHTLHASTRVDYVVFPLILGWGWSSGRQRIQLQAGAYLAFLDHSEVRWTVDGEPYAGIPTVEFRDNPDGFLFGTEYGFRLGAGELLLGVEAQRGSRSLASGLRGSIKSESARVHLAYAWTAMRR